MMGAYDWVTTEMFDAKLAEMIDREPARNLLSISGVYEAVAENYNNDVLAELERERDESEEDDGQDG